MGEHDGEGVMVQEPAKAQGGGPTDSQPQNTASQQTVEDVKRELEETRKSLKSLQATHQKAVETGKAVTGIAPLLAEIKAQMEEQEMNLAVLRDDIMALRNAPLDDFGANQDQTNVPRTSQSSVERLKADKEARKQRQELDAARREDIIRQAKVFHKALEKAGIDPEKVYEEGSPLFNELLKGSKTPADSLERLMEKMEREEAIKAEQGKKAEVEKKAAEIKKSGALDNVGGIPNKPVSGIPRTKAELGPYIRNLTSEQYAKLRADIEKVKASPDFK